LFDTSGFATRRDVSYKVGGTLEEIGTTSAKSGLSVFKGLYSSV
jgi:hypothetical protein